MSSGPVCLRIHSTFINKPFFIGNNDTVVQSFVSLADLGGSRGRGSP